MSGFIQVSAKAGEGDDVKEATIEYDFGENLEESSEMFGAEVVHSSFRAHAKVKLQAVMRNWIKAGKDCSELPDVWKPGVQMERVIDPIASALKKFPTLSPEEKAKFLEDLEAIS